jgi:hypothetical protein
MLNIGTHTQAIEITPGHTIQTVWGQRVEVFEITPAVGGATVTFNAGYRSQTTLGAEELVEVLGHFNPED